MDFMQAIRRIFGHIKTRRSKTVWVRFFLSLSLSFFSNRSDWSFDFQYVNEWISFDWVFYFFFFQCFWKFFNCRAVYQNRKKSVRLNRVNFLRDCKLSLNTRWLLSAQTGYNCRLSLFQVLKCNNCQLKTTQVLVSI